MTRRYAWGVVAGTAPRPEQVAHHWHIEESGSSSLYTSACGRELIVPAGHRFLRAEGFDWCSQCRSVKR